jgi:hypothetical protein
MPSRELNDKGGKRGQKQKHSRDQKNDGQCNFTSGERERSKLKKDHKKRRLDLTFKKKVGQQKKLHFAKILKKME